MSSQRVVVFGEGSHESGNNLDQSLSPNQLPALPQLIHRLMDNPSLVEYTCRSFKNVLPAHGRGHKFAGKVMRAVRKAKRDGFSAVAIVIDRDREPDKGRIGALREGRDAVDGLEYPPCAVGCAVETFDAWMITDGKAIAKAGGDSSKSHPEPEKLKGKKDTSDHPKNRAAEIFGVSVKNIPASKYATVALHIDLELLKKACPKGFKPFAEEVREKILPTISN